MDQHRPALVRSATFAIPIAFFALFFLYPLVTILLTALGSTANLKQAWAGLTAPVMGDVLWFSVWQAVASTALVMLVAVPGAWVLARFRFPGRSLIEALSVVAFVMPTVVVAAAVTALLGPTGPLRWLVGSHADHGIGAILLAHVYFETAIVLRMVSTYWAQLDTRLEQAAATLGASPWRIFRSVTLPRLRPVLLASASIVFLFTFTSFGIILLLGGPGQVNLEVEIQQQVLFLFNLPTGAALSIVQIIVVVLLLLVSSRLSGRLTPERSQVATPRRPHTTRQHIAVGGFIVGGLALLLLPPLMVVLQAFNTGDGWGWTNFQSLSTSHQGSVLFVPPGQAIGNSLIYACTATVIAIVIGGLVAVGITRTSIRPAVEGVWLLPLGVSAVTLGFGILIAFDSGALAWRGSFWMVPIAQALVAIPFVTRALVPALRAVSPSLRAAAACLGASPLQVFRLIDLPLIWRALVMSAAFAFAISLGEFGATVFVANSDRPTIPVAIYRLLSTPGTANQGQAMALAAILMAMTAAVVLLTERFRLPEQRHV